MKKIFLAGPILAIATMVPAFADTGSGSLVPHGHMWTDGYGMGLGFFGSGLMILFWGGLIALAVFAVRWMTKNDDARFAVGTEKASSALETLKVRLAKGEIDPEDYEARKKLLES
ncbi:SHOCT domain-containing protein [Pararhizobium sp. IMCC21322]|uniref:SHOCT domain-containing protein n=1 Tax=Pararhizobium sp. IMCC21322 TaxID=3067903 RepID=UPI002741C6F8|nr:SHOCT domain-containing protein [Pararhizobium sp. IMCC21322]